MKLDEDPPYYEALRGTVRNNIVTSAQGLDSAALFFDVATQDFCESR